MGVRTQIKTVAHQRGWTVAALGRRLKLYPSNLSAMDAGTRAVSLKTLGRIAHVLDCEPGDLLERSATSSQSVFADSTLNAKLLERQRRLADGEERAWVHATLLAWQRHYGARTKRPHSP